MNDLRNSVQRDLIYLNPVCMAAFQSLADVVSDFQPASDGGRWRLLPFEVLRHPARQALAVAEGRSHAEPWSSAHQYGLAVDFVATRDDKPGLFRWDAPADVYGRLRAAAEERGLSVPVSWDPGHVESPVWARVHRALIAAGRPVKGTSGAAP